MDEKPDYMIGLLARMFRVTPGTIRYYEDKGILVSRRGEMSSTRRYYARNVKLLFTIRKYLSMGFQVDDVKKLFSCETVSRVEDMMLDKQRELEKKIASLQENARALRDSRALINKACRLRGRCEMAERPEILVIVNQTGQELDQSDRIIRCVQKMNALLPLVYPASVVPARAILDKNASQIRMSGLCVCGETARSLDIGAGDGIIRLDAKMCLHTVLVFNFTPMPLMSELFAGCAEYMREHGLVPDGDAVGRDVMQTGEAQCLQTDGIEDAYRPKELYYEYWLPVRKI